MLSSLIPRNHPSFPSGLIEIDMVTDVGTTIGSGAGRSVMRNWLHAPSLFTYSALSPAIVLLPVRDVGRAARLNLAMCSRPKASSA
jgi:hypothetical protein